MAIYSGPEIVNSGLVFYYDMDNTEKSWKGAPTINVVSDSLPTSGWSVANYLGSSATLTYELEDNVPHLKITNVTLGSGSPDYPRIISSNFSQNITDGFSVSFEAKGTPGETIKLAIYSAGSTKSTNAAILTDKWTKYTFNNISTGFTLDQPYIRFDSNFGTSSVRYIRRIQIEQNSFATPFVNGTRSNTQAILDLTGSNTVTSSNLTYNSDGSFNHNGSSNFISLSPSIDCYLKSYSIEAWIKRNVSGATHGIITDPQFGWFYIAITSGNKLYAQHKHYNPVPDTVNSVTGSTTILNGLWYHVAVIWSSSGFRLYVNGILDGSNSDSNAFALSGPTRGPLYIGRAETSTFGSSPNWFNGTIKMLKGYSGIALTASEVLQNFEASRDRYGV